MPPFAGRGPPPAESPVSPLGSPFTVELPARSNAPERVGGGDGRRDGTKAESRTDPAGNWRRGIVLATLGVMVGDGRGMEPRHGGIARMVRRVGNDGLTNGGFHRVEPQRDFAESDQGTVIMLASSGDDRRSRGFA